MNGFFASKARSSSKTGKDSQMWAQKSQKVTPAVKIDNNQSILNANLDLKKIVQEYGQRIKNLEEKLGQNTDHLTFTYQT
jgi:ribosome-binding protein aMBF1 (putative translation factor)